MRREGEGKGVVYAPVLGRKINFYTDICCFHPLPPSHYILERFILKSIYPLKYVGNCVHACLNEFIETLEFSTDEVLRKGFFYLFIYYNFI